jgi:antitoxin component YwqK of YwqJK toxin-antitoxin module
MGDLYYEKSKKEDYWAEYFYGSNGKDTKVKSYNLNDKLLKETIYKQDSDSHSKYYYESTGNLKFDFYFKQDENHLSGKWMHYYEDGNIRIEQVYCTYSPFEISEGIWKWYNKDGTLQGQKEFKAEVVTWGNGSLKYAGGYEYLQETNEWVKTGTWKWYKETGELESEKKYDLGKEIEKDSK